VPGQTPRPEISDDMRRAFRRMVETAELLKRIGVTDHRQVETPPGPAGFLMRLTAMFVEEDCSCGGEHLTSDHPEVHP
jgi:hypothetical protein